MSLMEIRNLTKSYDEGEVSTLVLRGLDFKIEKGEFVQINLAAHSGFPGKADGRRLFI